MKARDAMTRVTWLCHVGDPLSRVAATMKEKACGFLPVFDDGKQLAGVVTDRDLALSLVGRPTDAADRTVSEVMTRDVVQVRASDEIESVIQAMELALVRRVVVDDGGVPVGIVSLTGLAEQAELLGIPPARLLAAFRKINERIPREARRLPALPPEPDPSTPEDPAGC
jgi:CBS domain-containing protein